MPRFIENIKNIENHRFPIIYYALNSACRRKEACKVHSRIYRYLSFYILGRATYRLFVEVRSRMTLATARFSDGALDKRRALATAQMRTGAL